ncbi:hypothetical protein BDK51DRAFT_35338 [Blyttiomyces helicus]|uniref:Uncharacterized protein n=1 Tax=Blyttiomyces helicus TaxID=388810 RepID=A0A4P9WIK9_9FUNG|nr:hypothetical protein BDK51DRAFT_35338 [Blyttiomyces helicus]|eukprot:RKO92624.1 hypothetical protein BDK51DRAFT_35338 [Blyttiomyces helicus]
MDRAALVRVLELNYAPWSQVPAACERFVPRLRGVRVFMVRAIFWQDQPSVGVFAAVLASRSHLVVLSLPPPQSLLGPGVEIGGQVQQKDEGTKRDAEVGAADRYADDAAEGSKDEAPEEAVADSVAEGHADDVTKVHDNDIAEGGEDDPAKVGKDTVAVKGEVPESDEDRDAALALTHGFDLDAVEHAVGRLKYLSLSGVF